MALTKPVQATLDAWAEVAQNAVREGTILDVSADYASTLHIDFAITSDADHTGTNIIVQASSNSSGDNDWSNLVELISLTETAANIVGVSPSGTEAVGQTVIEVAATAGFESDKITKIFIEDTGTVADSELADLVSHVSNVSITLLDGLTNAKDSSDVIWNRAATYNVSIPFTVQRVRVVIDNTYDSDGATVHTRTRVTKVTAV